MAIASVLGSAVAAWASNAAVLPRAWAADPRPVQASPAPSVPVFGTETEMVYLRFHIVSKGKLVAAARRDQLRILENGKPQPIAVFETPETRDRAVPPELTLLLDVSGSIMDYGLLSRDLVERVLLASLGDEALVSVCALSDKLECFGEATRDSAALMAAFEETQQFGLQRRNRGTALYDSVAQLCRQTAERPHKTQRAVIIFSDGEDNRDGKVDDAIKAAKDAGVLLYPVALGQGARRQAPGSRMTFGGGPGSSFSDSQSRMNFDYHKLDFARLGPETGGQTFEPATLDSSRIEDILRAIANEVKMECVAGYAIEVGEKERKRSIKIEVVDKSLGKVQGGERTIVR